MLRYGRFQPHPCGAGNVSTLHRYPPFGYGGRDDGFGCHDICDRFEGRTQRPHHKILFAARLYSRSRKCPCSRRNHHARYFASAAVKVELDGRKIRKAQVAMGGVGTIPWRSPEAEHELAGAEASERNFRRAAEAALRGAKAHKDNGFKIELAKRTLVRALQTVTQA